MNEERMRELFREMREEPVPPDSLARVRMRVADRTQSRRGSFWRYVAVALAALCVVMAVALSRVPEPAPPEVMHVAVTNPLVGYRPPEPAAPKVAKAAAPVRPRAESVAGKDVMIRIETPDPDVVLFFVAGGSAE